MELEKPTQQVIASYEFHKYVIKKYSELVQQRAKSNLQQALALL